MTVANEIRTKYEDNDYAVQLININKTFPGPVWANVDINLNVYKGEIHALLGENGAGKTTLMNILYGLYEPDDKTSQIYINGKEVRIKDPIDAMKNGIGMVHQHFMLVPVMTVAENVGLGSEPTLNGLRLDYFKMRHRVIDISHEYGLDIDPDALIQDLPVGIQQRVEIVKILYRGAEILILDEPTAVLTPQEVDALFKTLKILQSQGKTIIIITHKLKEPIALADRITVLRDGRVIGTVNTSETSAEKLAEMMIGRKLLRIEKSEIKTGQPLMEIQNLVVYDDRGQIAVNQINLRVHEREILGLAGVVGNGQKELVEAITGLRPIESGNLSLKGYDYTNADPRTLYDCGLAHIPEDRQKTGSIGEFTIAENLIIGLHHQHKWYKNHLFLNWDLVNADAEQKVKMFDIRAPSIQTKLKHLSGGNQQKVIVARELSRDPSVIVASQPTRGLDVGVIEYVHQRLLQLRNDGKGVLLISSDLDEILSLSDRIAVIYEGRIVSIEDPTKTNELRLGLLMAGHTTEG
ncbi:MAG: ABC transporter ATP-binding protein [Candidatus Hodarchaeales archaeon]